MSASVLLFPARKKRFAERVLYRNLPANLFGWPHFRNLCRLRACTSPHIGRMRESPPEISLKRKSDQIQPISPRESPTKGVFLAGTCAAFEEGGQRFETH